ncbi:hypothetical protein TrCOL_g1893 [Triparma columacea]|uniref:Uncharacterized protein n=1 Tax=Triparma columacea TaxID=722753 RepID=A0A9W7L248_9STRA|nr:hypothetical protein TrCOL_g1893 [Triparma columacea]
MSSRVRRPTTGRSNSSQNSQQQQGENKQSSFNRGPTKSMAERINERLALIATSKVQKMEMGDEQDGRPFTPTDHALTERPRLANMNLFPHEIDKAMESLTTVDMSYQTKLKRSNLFKSTFPNHYVDYIEAEPETMQFDQSLATDKVKQEKIAKEFITRNRHRMWMFDVNYVKKGHGTVLKKMLECENFPGLMDELTMKERKFDRGQGSASVTACLTMPKKLITPDLQNDVWLSTSQRTSRKERMNRMFMESNKTRITDNNRVNMFKTT